MHKIATSDRSVTHEVEVNILSMCKDGYGCLTVDSCQLAGWAMSDAVNRLLDKANATHSGKMSQHGLGRNCVLPGRLYIE